MRSIYAFMRRIQNLITTRVKLHHQVMIHGSDKLASEQPHGLRIAITPSSVATVGSAAIAKIDRRSG